MKILKANIKDIKQLAIVEMSSGYHKKKFDFKPFLEELFNEGAKIFCAEEKGKLIGYITLNKKGEIEFLAVSKKFQGRGIASLLLKNVILSARKQKLKRLFLDVKGENLSAINLYFKNDFKVTRKYKKNVDGKEIIKWRLVKKI